MELCYGSSILGNKTGKKSCTFEGKNADEIEEL